MGLMDKLKNPYPQDLQREADAASRPVSGEASAQQQQIRAAVMGEASDVPHVAPYVPPAVRAIDTRPALKPEDDPVYSLVTAGDLSKLSKDQRLSYYHKVCAQVGLNPLTKPFDFVTLNGKTILYANKDAASQLARVHRVSVEVLSKEYMKEAGTLLVWTRARTPDGRITDEVGGCGLFEKQKGDDVANAYMKALTKAKRRAILAHCGLGMLDEAEVEVEAIPGAKVERIEVAQKVQPVHPAIAPTPEKTTPKTAREVVIDAGADGEGGVPGGASEDDADGRAGASAGGDFNFEGRADRQWLIKEITSKFPGVTKAQIQQIAQTYAKEHSRAEITVMLDEVYRQLKAQGKTWGQDGTL